MTTAFFRSFFPSAFETLSGQLPDLWEMLQPAHLATSCPELIYLGNGLHLRNPTLVPLQILGMIIGLGLSLRIRGNEYWAAAFRFYGLMNFVSLFAHSVFAPPTPLWKLFAVLDVALTGASAVCLLMSRFSVSGDTWLVATSTLVITAVGSAHQVPFISEFVYIGLTLLAAAVLLVSVPKTLRSKTQRFSFIVALLGLVLIAVGT